MSTDSDASEQADMFIRICRRVEQRMKVWRQRVNDIKPDAGHDGERDSLSGPRRNPLRATFSRTVRWEARPSRRINLPGPYAFPARSPTPHEADNEPDDEGDRHYRTPTVNSARTISTILPSFRSRLLSHSAHYARTISCSLRNSRHLIVGCPSSIRLLSRRRVNACSPPRRSNAEP